MYRYGSTPRRSIMEIVRKTRKSLTPRACARRDEPSRRAAGRVSSEPSALFSRTTPERRGTTRRPVMARTRKRRACGESGGPDESAAAAAVQTPPRVAEAHPSREDCITCRMDCSTLKNAPLRRRVEGFERHHLGTTSLRGLLVTMLTVDSSRNMSCV